MNKKSMAYKRGLFIEQFDKMLREEELRIFKDPNRNSLYELESRKLFGSADIYGTSQPMSSIAINMEEESAAAAARDMDFIIQDSNYNKIEQYRINEYKEMIETLTWKG